MKNEIVQQSVMRRVVTTQDRHGNEVNELLILLDDCIYLLGTVSQFQSYSTHFTENKCM